MRFFLLLAMALAFVAVTFSRASAACALPDLAMQTPAFLVKVRTAWQRSEGMRLHWVAVSLGHAQGSLYIFDCRGGTRAELDLGEIESVKPGPFVAGRPTMVVAHHETYGFDFEQVHVSILEYRAGRILELWNHILFHHDSPPRQLGTNEITTYRWHTLQNASRIEVSGRKVTGDPPKVRVRRLRAERYCFNEHAVKYLPCA